MPAHNRLRPYDRDGVENAGRNAVQQYEDEPIEHAEGRALGCAATKHIQLLTKRDYLSLERAPRPEKVEEQPLH
jgi:hypothetical protein